MTDSDGFEDALRDRLAGRSREITPHADVDDLGARLGVARRKRQRTIAAGVGGFCIAVFGVAGAFALGDGGDSVDVAGTGVQSRRTTTTTALSVSTTVPVTVFTGERGGATGQLVTTTTIDPRQLLVPDIQQLLVVLLDPSTTDPQRAALVAADVDDALAALRAHKRYEELGGLTVTGGEVTFSPDGTTAELDFELEREGRNGTVRVVVVIDGDAVKLTQASFCTTLAYVTEFVGGPQLQCGDAVPPGSSTTTTTSVPVTTTTAGA